MEEAVKQSRKITQNRHAQYEEIWRSRTMSTRRAEQEDEERSKRIKRKRRRN
jgi:hypothetical protein